ncbi:insulinase family protein [Lysinibacillus fusiformis]|uniref:insulinase family protein n=1 Tax=Lysinibacillus sp. PWR01 TaxID=3342384 RepID=UPI00372D42D4
MEVNELYHGFKVDKKEKIQEISGTVFLMKHIKTGANLVYVRNEDEHKAFSIGFKTPAENDTGVFHILEHCVLSGSKKYPVKEPMVELMKGSMKTYLNASTYPDKTLYSLASVNSKDLSNLIDVILDAVFFPRLYEQKEIFQQEGWHLAYREDKKEFIYKGIVYNEMKGTLSSPQQRLIHSMFKALYPFTPYATVSGGDPQHITSLTYEKLLEAHQKYYHPSNCLVYLYGDVNIEEGLQQIDEVLSKFEHREVIPPEQDDFQVGEFIEIKSAYPISEKQIEEESTFLSYAYKVKDLDDKKLNVTLIVLYKLLLEGNSGILRKRLLEEKLGKDVIGYVDYSLKHPLFAICASNSEVKNKENFIKVVQETLQELVKDGIDKELIESALISTEFELREADYGVFPSGLTYGIKAASNWIAQKSLFDSFKYENSIEELKLSVSERYFENFIEEHLLNSKHSAVIVCSPSKQIAKEEIEDEQQKLEMIKNSVDRDDIESIIEENAKLSKFQSTADSNEAKATLPNLLITEINPQPLHLPLKEIRNNGFNLLFHNHQTKKVVYYNLYFNVGEVKEDLSYYRLFTELLGKLGTSKYTSDNLASEITLKIGKLAIDNHLYSETIESCHHKVAVKIRTTYENITKSLKLVHHILTETSFEDKSKVKELIGNMVSNMKNQLNNNGNIFASLRINSNLSAAGYLNENLSGITFYQFLIKLENEFEQRYESMVEKLKEIAINLFSKSNLVVGLTGDTSVMTVFSNSLSKLDLPAGNIRKTVPLYLKEKISKEAYTNSNSVVHVVQGGNFKEAGFEYSGHMLVLAKILNLTYLWKNLRVKGGAYGGGINISINGNLNFYSYRDPNLVETLEIFNKTSSFVENLDLTKAELQRYIIGTIADLDKPMNARLKGERADTNYFINNTYEMRAKVREEILKTTVEDLRSLSKVFKAMEGKQPLCVVGNENKINEQTQLFDFSLPLHL